jgi:hypothetical protein
MFKNALILFLVLVLASGVFSVRLIDPLSKELLPSETNDVGSVSIGNSMELIFSKELTNPYQSVEVVSGLPTGFDYSVSYELESMKLVISVPKSATIGFYTVFVKLSGPSRSEVIPIRINVIEGALDVSPSEVFLQETSVDGSVIYKFFFVNNSDGLGRFIITSDLPSGWLSEDPLSKQVFSKSVVVPRRENAESTVIVYPRLQGKKDFKVRVSYENSFRDFSFSVVAQPTLKSKLGLVNYGLPFYSFSLLPGYFINGIVSFWVK